MKKIIFLLFIVTKSFSQAGTFDTTFDTDGKQTYCLTPLADFLPTNAGLQSTGKIVQFGYYNDYHNKILIRYNTDGSVDSGFGSNGTQTFTANSFFQSQGYIRDFAIQSDDKIVVVGEDSVVGNFVIRLLPDGNLDTSFNGVGYMSFDFGSNNAYMYNIIVQPDGKILVCGCYGNGLQTIRPYFAVARITNSGALDATFGNGGKVLTDFSANGSTAYSMTTQPDGKIVVGGITKNATTQANNFALVRFNSNGTVDTTFGTDGKVITSDIIASYNGITKLLLQPDGKIVAGGLSIGMTMARYLPNGALDPTFGTNGIVATNESSYKCSIAMQADGKFILAGGSNSFKVFRYTATGVLDTSFANNANVFLGTEGEATTVLIQNDQKIIVCGNTYNLATLLGCAAVIRLNNDVLGTEGFATNEVGVFPNPVQDELTISNEETMQYELFTILGAKIQAGSLAVHGQVDCSSLAKGLYLLKLNKDNGESKVVKVVKD